MANRLNIMQIKELAMNLEEDLDCTATTHNGELCLRLVHAAEYLRSIEERGGTGALTEMERIMVDHVRFAAESYAKALGVPMKLAAQGIRVMVKEGSEKEKCIELPENFT